MKKLPEGTVVSAYVSFNELIDTSEVFNRFLDKNLDITWLAVNTGLDEQDEDFGGVIFDPFGFPTTPIWHEDDMIQDSYEEEDTSFGSVVSESSHSPEYEEGDTDLLHKQFLKTLKSLVKHEKKVEKLYYGFDLNLEKRIEYLNKNGIDHYGIVVTGPTKEILDLQNKEIIGSLQIDEVAFWNWDD